MTIDQKTITLLQTLGLTTYEAKAYAVLAQIGSTTPFTLAEEAGIPRTKIYDTIKRLERQHWITVEKGRPGKITPVCPGDAIGSRKSALLADIDQMANEFTMTYEKRTEAYLPKTNIVRGIGNIAIKTADMMRRARTSLYLFGTLYYPEELEPIKQQLDAAKRRGVILRISSNNPVRTKENILDVRESFSRLTKDFQIAPEPFIRTLTIDSKEMLMMFPMSEEESVDQGNLVALWIENEMVTKAINNAFNIMWANPEWTGNSP
ncbi:TrmB family transcriptional regulator [Methanosphaerula palustris]|uniref:Transcriptional regulator, TrmB n=1 Tax=Methanosphaerula palustris (strain ATCC BAA-1556 / DSM 19958 / E1-9c) TaxID=521011 RepID=B8GHK9_METPE|nr:helix-turn-helix domain-containing protein [Methanosphaerula palustris]ACL16614.1 transcriptional regulator, TrmB [Methanosphaerula palustris E1-9c]